MPQWPVEKMKRREIIAMTKLPDSVVIVRALVRLQVTKAVVRKLEVVYE